jgi:periplasmic divalent cation tolerance protein
VSSWFNLCVKSAAKFSIVLVTAPDLKTARKLAQRALKEKLIACANLIPRIESHYWWQGKIESSAEVLCVFKTARTKLGAFEQFILTNHPYDTPEIISLSLASGTERYLQWLVASAK